MKKIKFKSIKGTKVEKVEEAKVEEAKVEEAKVEEAKVEEAKVEENQVQMNELTVVDNLRIYGTKEEPMFLAKDVAELLGLNNITEMLRNVDDDEKLKSVILKSGQKREVWFLKEHGFYEVLMLSRKPIAKKFKKIVKERLTELRKHGVTATRRKLEDMLSDPNTMIKTLEALRDERQKSKQLEHLIEENQPKVDFANTIIEIENGLDIGTFAKLVYDEFEMGRNKLFAWLRSNGYLMENNVPYQKWMEHEYFKIVAVTNKNNRINSKTILTGKGKFQLFKKLSEHKTMSKEKVVALFV